MQRIVNLTPHDVVVVNESGDVVTTFPKQQEPATYYARVMSTPQEGRGSIVGTMIPLVTPQVPIAVDIQAPMDDPDAIIVSMMTADALQGKHKIYTNIQTSVRILVPDSGPASAVRKDGVLVGVRRLVDYGFFPFRLMK